MPTSLSVPDTVPSSTTSWEMYQPPVKPTTKTLVILGEAPGAEEEASGQPFVGSAGRQLRRMFEEAGLDIDQWHILNTFLKRPPSNDLKQWTATKTQCKQMGIVPSGDPLAKRYLLPIHRWQIEELEVRLRTLKPDLILALGGTALWTLSGQSAVTNFRGNFFQSRFGYAIASLHPASILYQWSNLPLAWADLTKVRHWLEDKLPTPLTRKLWINPTFAEIANVYALFNRNPHWQLGVDVETCPPSGQITTVSYATAQEGICIPIWDRYAVRGAQNYWPTVKDEVKAWRWIERFAHLPNPKVLQNGLYDMQYFLDCPIPMRLRNVTDDTAIMSHSYQPELQKKLGILSSLYLNEPSWKQMRTSEKESNKADD